MGAWTWVTIYILIGLATGGFIHLAIILLAKKADDEQYDIEDREEIRREVEGANRVLRAGNITTPTFYAIFALLWPAVYVMLIKEAFKGGTH
ncbi:hypothetical protein HMSSN036_51830 [Paenibacillus macerans]|nr:hypothetical protein HMSSN036_51830 [Paenibacillus macerans]